MTDQPWSPPCRDCGPGYRIGDEGCRHGDYQPENGETGVCRTCCKPISWETGEIGHCERIGWSDRINRGGDSIVCFRAADYRHVPMGGREAAIYKAAFKAGRAEVVAKAEALIETWTAATCQQDGAPCSWHRVAAECADELKAALTEEPTP